MRIQLIAALAAFLPCAVPVSAQVAVETGKANADRDWSAVGVDNDNLQGIIKAAKVSVVGRAPEAASPSAPAAPASAATPAARAAKRFTIGIAGICDNKFFAIPSWCPQAGPGVNGGVEREIVVDQGDEVEITLTNSRLWSPGTVSFVLTAADPIGVCAQRPIPAAQEENCGRTPQFGAGAVLREGGSQTIRFTADQAGRYRYYDETRPSGYGVLTVKP